MTENLLSRYGHWIRLLSAGIVFWIALAVPWQIPSFIENYDIPPNLIKVCCYSIAIVGYLIVVCLVVVSLCKRCSELLKALNMFLAVIAVIFGVMASAMIQKVIIMESHQGVFLVPRGLTPDEVTQLRTGMTRKDVDSCIGYSREYRSIHYYEGIQVNRYWADGGEYYFLAWSHGPGQEILKEVREGDDYWSATTIVPSLQGETPATSPSP